MYKRMCNKYVYEFYEYLFRIFGEEKKKNNNLSMEINEKNLFVNLN